MYNNDINIFSCIVVFLLRIFESVLLNLTTESIRFMSESFLWLKQTITKTQFKTNKLYEVFLEQTDQNEFLIY